MKSGMSDTHESNSINTRAANNVSKEIGTFSKLGVKYQISIAIIAPPRINTVLVVLFHEFANTPSCPKQKQADDPIGFLAICDNIAKVPLKHTTAVSVRSSDIPMSKAKPNRHSTKTILIDSNPIMYSGTKSNSAMVNRNCLNDMSFEIPA